MKSSTRKQAIAIPAIAATAVAVLAGCVAPAPEAPRKPLMGYPTMTGLAQVRDQSTGATYFAPCDPCSGPTAKTPAGNDIPLAATPAAPAASAPVSGIVQPAGTTAKTIESLAKAVAQAVSVGAGRAAATAPLNVEVKKPAASTQKRVIFFAYAASGLGREGRKATAELAAMAKQAQHISIKGFVDSTGTAAANERLAMARATAVGHQLFKAGVSKQKVEMTHCSKCFLASNDTEEGRRANRRVEVELVMASSVAAKTSMPTN